MTARHPRPCFRPWGRARLAGGVADYVQDCPCPVRPHPVPSFLLPAMPSTSGGAMSAPFHEGHAIGARPLLNVRFYRRHADGPAVWLPRIGKSDRSKTATLSP
jgi:hypothetical protein